MCLKNVDSNWLGVDIAVMWLCIVYYLFCLLVNFEITLDSPYAIWWHSSII